MRFSTSTILAAVAVAAATQVRATTDIDTLNYALTLEHLEAAFYNQAMALFNEAAFTSAGYAASVHSNSVLIQGHENAHVKFLNTTIASLGGTPAQACSSYNFGTALANVSSFIQYAYTYETYGVEAYDGALNTLSNPVLQQAAATIATIEARHATFFQQYQQPAVTVPMGSGGGDPQGSFDAAANSTTVAGIVGSLLSGGCATLTLPVARTRPSNYSTAYVGGTTSTLAQNDINALNYALFLENFEAAFYKYYVGTQGGSGLFNANSFSAQDTLQNVAAGTTLNRLQLIASHEAAHVSFLNTALSGHSPVQPCSAGYNFNSSLSASDFLKLAATIEGAGVTAYDGAINAITDPTYAQAAATIATIEARHADYLLSVSAQAQFTADSGANNGAGGAFDTANSPATIASAVQGLNIIPASCFQGVTLPAAVKTTSSTPAGSAAGSLAVSYKSVVAAALAAAAAIMA